MAKLKVGIVGYSGRMGSELARLIGADKNLQLVIGICRSGSGEGLPTSKDFSHPLCKTVDLWIDFSLPEVFASLVSHAIKHQQAIVSGTTGITDKDAKLIQKAGTKIPILWASNMSIGIATLRKALEVFKGLEGFDFQIEESHHNKKKDRPSGTAKTLEKDLQKQIKSKLPETIVMRAGGIYGVHKIHAVSDEEHLEFSHTALNRAVFAKGAIKAALWLKAKKPGVYDIMDVVGR